MTASSSQEPVTVGIIGGGVGGLALAKMLEMAGVSYRLFEAYELVPEAGASIGLIPSGLRILDQLGVIDEIEKWSFDHDRWEHRDGITGELYTSTKAARAYPGILGYGSFFMDRHHILSVLFNSIQDKSRLHAFKKVVSIENLAEKAIIKTASGENFACQVVAGADGVHSIVRQFVRQEVPETPKISPDYLSADTYCVFGISAPVSSIGEGRHFTIYHPGASLLVFSGVGGKLYWFVFKPLQESLKYSERRKYTQEDTQAACDTLADALVTDGVRFSQILKQEEYKITLSIQQGICETWHAGRMFLLGDATHKMTPHAAMGANLAIESAACFVNKLMLLRDGKDTRSLENMRQHRLTECLESYTEQRRGRVTALMELAGTTQEIQLRIGPKSDAFINALPRMNEHDWIIRPLISFSQAEKLEGWKCDSERVAKYTSVAARVLDAKERGRENELLDSILASLAVN